MAAAVEGGHEEQEGCHADNGDDEGHAEAVLGLFWRPLVPKLHVTDTHLQKTGSGSLSEFLFLSKPFCLGSAGAYDTTLLSPLPSSCLLDACKREAPLQ